jgi:7-carboxy-7-deazaguanine synthase
MKLQSLTERWQRQLEVPLTLVLKNGIWAKEMLKINEIFFSIQGESTRAGLATTFVRTTGCNLRCTYCDTQYSYYDGTLMNMDAVISKIKSYATSYVCITGGEPLLQKEIFPLISELCDLGYHVSVETSGSLSIELVDLRAKIVIDVKTPDSGAGNSFHFGNLSFLNRDIEFKFVICSEHDLEWSESFCRQHEILQKNTVLYSPSWGQVSPKWLSEKILEKKSSARLQLQLHKYIWLPETRGV